jgi:hypothetical protein
MLRDRDEPMNLFACIPTFSMRLDIDSSKKSTKTNT